MEADIFFFTWLIKDDIFKSYGVNTICYTFLKGIAYQYEVCECIFFLFFFFNGVIEWGVTDETSTYIVISSKNIIAISSFNDAVKDNLLKLKLGSLLGHIIKKERHSFPNLK